MVVCHRKLAVLNLFSFLFFSKRDRQEGVYCKIIFCEVSIVKVKDPPKFKHEICMRIDMKHSYFSNHKSNFVYVLVHRNIVNV